MVSGLYMVQSQITTSYSSHLACLTLKALSMRTIFASSLPPWATVSQTRRLTSFSARHQLTKKEISITQSSPASSNMVPRTRMTYKKETGCKIYWSEIRTILKIIVIFWWPWCVWISILRLFCTHRLSLMLDYRHIYMQLFYPCHHLAYLARLKNCLQNYPHEGLML